MPASCEGQYALKVDGDRLTGRGVGDDKGSALAVAQTLVALVGKGVSVGCIFGADEETGGFTTTWMVERKGYRPRKMAIVLDSKLPEKCKVGLVFGEKTIKLKMYRNGMTVILK